MLILTECHSQAQRPSLCQIESSVPQGLWVSAPVALSLYEKMENSEEQQHPLQDDSAMIHDFQLITCLKCLKRTVRERLVLISFYYLIKLDTNTT